MSTVAFTALSAGADPALQASVLSELDTAVERLDEAVSTLTILRDACFWRSEGVEALRWALCRLVDDTATARRQLQECRREAESV